jgi:hypothetical protein
MSAAGSAKARALECMRCLRAFLDFFRLIPRASSPTRDAGRAFVPAVYDAISTKKVKQHEGQSHRSGP